MFGALGRIFSSRANRSEDGQHEEATITIGIQVDRPVEKMSDDLFDRAPFARQIANVIAVRHDPSSVVIGLYGPWGDGKTSALSMIKECLSSNKDIITMDYNPWFYGDSTESLARGFFASIKSKLEATGLFSRDNIGALLEKFGESIPHVGGAVKRLGEVITTEALTNTRDKLGEILRRHGKKVVIFIDDIDRLDRSDIQTLFKLVRLSGGFDRTTYVLAFDDAIVAEALGEAYGAGDPAAGRRFLEKIVQVPLHLPPPKPEKLRELMFAACDRCMGENEIQFQEGEGSELGSALATAFIHVLKTPRQVKLFENAISFAVPLLKGEVRVVEQIQIEGIRVFYPEVYDSARRNPDALLRSRDQRAEDRPPSPIETAIARIEGSDEEKETLRNLLVQLFPRFGSMGYGSDWDRRWSEEKRACSSDYFSRYFTYTVPTGDISDLVIDELLNHSSRGDGEATGAVIQGAYQRGAAELLIRKLRSREKTLSEDAAPTLISEISARASSIPISRDLFMGDFVLSQASAFVINLAARFEPAGQDELLAKSAEDTDSLLFLAHSMRHSRREAGAIADNTRLPPERIHPLAATLLRRMLDLAGGTSLFDNAGDNLGKLIYTVRADGRDDTVEEMRSYLDSLITLDASNSVRLIKALAGRSQGGDGVTRVSDITRDTYLSISKVVEPDRIYGGLLLEFGEEIGRAKWRGADDDTGDLDRRVANQFAYLHLNPSESVEEVTSE